MIKDNFFDRKTYLEILEKRIGDLKDGYRHNIAIVGDELVGKTSIIFKFLSNFYDNRIIIIYLETRPESLASFAKRFIGVLLYNFLINSGTPLREDLDFLISKSEKYIPQTVERIKSIFNALEKRRKNNVFFELLSLLEIVNKETGKFCVVIFDEFHSLENLGIKNLYPEWSRLLISQKNIMYMIISSMKLKAKAILSKNLSLLFGNFEIITVDPFDTKTSTAYLEHMLHGLSLDTGLKNFLIHFTGGNPFYLELIAKELLNADIFDTFDGAAKPHPEGQDLKAPLSITLSKPWASTRSSRRVDLADILEELLFKPSGILNQKFSNYLKRFLDIPHSQDYITILYLISNGCNKLKEITHILHKQRKELMLRVNYLLELDTISHNGDFLKINDRVFSFWLRFVYQEKLHSLTFDAKSQKILFRDKIKGMIQEFLINAQKPLIERTMELLRLFEDNIIQVEKKRLKLTHFREIKTLEFNNRRLKEGIIGRSQDSLWIIAFKQDLLAEEDITEFASECKKYHSKLQHKIIIALRDIDANTRLKALEEKIWMWDLNKLNQILDLYYKPRFII